MKHESVLSNGIFVDIGTRFCSITGNTVINSPRGILNGVNNPNITIRENFIAFSRVQERRFENNIWVKQDYFSIKVFYNEDRNITKKITLNSFYYDINGKRVYSIEINPLNAAVVYEDNPYYYLVLIPFLLIFFIVIIFYSYTVIF
jgi:hypothetical protein